jgi:hypothetical protein
MEPIMSMFSQGVSNKTSPLKRDRVFHMIVRDGRASTGWRTWCGYGLAREDPPGPYLGVTKSRLCKKCRELTAEAIADETMSFDEAHPFVHEIGLT